MHSISGIGGEVGRLSVVDPARPGSVGGLGPAAGADGQRSFAAALGEAIQAVDGQQIAADQESAKLAMGGGNLHEVALSLEKADLALRVATKVRNRLVDAYQEVMRMSI
jgi:flagellar hook-basal body complex protein FliE